MKSYDLTEYILLVMKHIQLKDIALFITVLCLWLLILYVLKISISVVLIAAVLFAAYKALCHLIGVVTQLFRNQQQELAVL